MEARKIIERCRLKKSKNLDIGHNGYLTVLPEEIRELTWLTGLSMRCAGLRKIPDWIGELVNLKTLDISINHEIKKLPSGMRNLRNLKKLFLNNTGIKELPSFIGKMTSLELLDISTYYIKEAPQCILDLPKLKRIETGRYDITNTTAIMAKQRELDMKEALRRIKVCRKSQKVKINLSRLNLGELPNELGDLYWLEELDLSMSNLGSLPQWIGDFKNLAKLNLELNELTSLPDSIGNLKRLKEIDLSYNRLQTLPKTFCDLSSLEYFRLGETNNHPVSESFDGQESWFTYIPKDFGKLSSLKEFWIDCTRVTNLPKSFGGLKSLRKLSIQECISDNFFFPPSMKNLTALREVSICGLDHLPDFIGELKDLTTLDISHNKLYVLPEWIGGLTNLETLNLHSTWISELPEWLTNLKKLKNLDISSNELKDESEILKKFPNLNFCG